MRVMLLAAGMGTRLRPVTETVPKCLVPICGKPLLQIWIDRLVNRGFGPFLVNTHYLSEQVDFFVENSQHSKLITLAYEKNLLGTAGSLNKNIFFFGESDGILAHADNYCLDDFDEFLIAHKNRPAECLLTMMTFRASSPSSCGIVKVDQRGVVKEYYEKVVDPPGNLANGAIYILSSDFLGMVKHEFNNAIDFSNHILPSLVGKIFTYETASPLVDVGTLESLSIVNDMCSKADGK